MERCPMLGNDDKVYDGTIGASDYETQLDKIASMVGYIYNTVGGRDREEVRWVVEMLYHLMSAVRGEFTLTPQEVNEIMSLSHKYDSIKPSYIILPLGASSDASMCHMVRSELRCLVVLLHKFKRCKIATVDQRLIDIFEALSDYFFGMAVYKNSLMSAEFTSRV